jgi:CheY-like chemotaxis protein/HPt (histidine-containing phosphotransfer) domain-containing protein
LIITRPAKQDALLDCLLSILDPRTRQITDVVETPATHLPDFNLRVLIVEDNVINQKVAVKMLERLGCRCEVAADGVEALETILKMPFDLVFMDCRMPVMDGFEATREIRRLAAPIARAPIIAMTANGQTADREECLAAGMNDVLHKPVTFSPLIAMLEKWSPRSAAPDVAPPADHARPRTPGQPTSALDLDHVREVAAGDREFVAELLTGFQRDMERHLAHLRQAVAREDRHSIQRIAHSVKGSSASIGARPLARIAGMLQEAGAGEPVSRLRALVDLLEGEYERLVREVSRFLERGIHRL